MSRYSGIVGTYKKQQVGKKVTFRIWKGTRRKNYVVQKEEVVNHAIRE